MSSPQTITDLSSADALPPVFILAGGQGTRLRSVLPDTPKPLAQVAGRPFLCWWFAALASQGIRKVTLCTGYKSDSIQELFGDSWGPISLEYSLEKQPLGTGGAIALAARRTDHQWMLVLNGDSYCDVDVRKFWRRHVQRGAFASMTCVRVPDTRRYGRVDIRPDGRITGFEEKHATRGEGWINAGIYLLPRQSMTSLLDNTFCSLEREILPDWTSSGLYGEAVSGRFIDIGTPDSYAEAQNFFKPAETGT